MPAPLDLVPALLEGLAVTLVLALGGTAVALVASLAAGVARAAGPRAVRALAGAYVETFRGTSALVQLFWGYYALPLLGVELGAMATGIAVLGLNAGAYGAEVVRGALLAVPRTQREAGQALGLSARQILWRVELPQAVPAILPPAGNVLIELVKNTSLASLITLQELTFRGQVLRAESLRTVEIFGLVLLIYFAVNSVAARLVRLLEKRVTRHRRAGLAR